MLGFMIDLGGAVLTLFADGAESLWDELLPARSGAAGRSGRLDELLSDSELLAPIAVRWERELAEAGRFAGRGRPSIAMETLRAVDGAQAPFRVGVRDVDARGVGLDPSAAVLPDRVDRAGAGRVDGAQADPPVGRRGGARALARADTESQAGEAVPAAGGADRLDRGRSRRASYPTDSGLAADGVRALAREARKLAAKIGANRTAVGIARGRSGGGARAHAHDASPLGAGEAEVLKLTGRPASCWPSVKEARRLAAAARRRRSGRGARRSSRPPALEELADRCEKVVRADHQRVNGEKITDRLVSLWDPDARPIRKGKLSSPTSSGTSISSARSPPNTKPGARGFILPPASQIGNPAEDTLLPTPPAS